MKKMTVSGMFVSLAAIGLLLGGCVGSQQARSMDLQQTGTILVNPAILEKGADGQALYRYANPAANFRQYTRVMIEPVIVVKQGDLDTGERENYQKLANNAFVYLNQELATQMTVVTAPGPDTLRIQLAIVDADSSKPVRNLLSTVMPIGMGLSLVKYAATGKPSGVGEITVELKITDALTGQLLGAAMDRRVGGKAAQGIWDTWYNADDALQYWAKKCAWYICDAKGGKNCVNP